jgi:protein TonB
LYIAATTYLSEKNRATRERFPLRGGESAATAIAEVVGDDAAESGDVRDIAIVEIPATWRIVERRRLLGALLTAAAAQLLILAILFCWAANVDLREARLSGKASVIHLATATKQSPAEPTVSIAPTPTPVRELPPPTPERSKQSVARSIHNEPVRLLEEIPAQTAAAVQPTHALPSKPTAAAVNEPRTDANEAVRPTPRRRQTALPSFTVNAVLAPGFDEQSAKILEIVQPTFPQEVIDRQMLGVIRVEVTISAEGRVAAAKIISTSGYGLLDQVALNTVRKWRFEPARRNGQPVESTIDLPPLRFRK